MISNVDVDACEHMTLIIFYIVQNKKVTQKNLVIFHFDDYYYYTCFADNNQHISISIIHFNAMFFNFFL